MAMTPEQQRAIAITQTEMAMKKAQLADGEETTEANAPGVHTLPYYVDDMGNIIPKDEPQPQTLQENAQDAFGFNDYVERGTLLPLGKTQDGEIEFAMPQIAVDMATSSLLPGHAYEGGSYTGDDVSRFALDYAVPASISNPSRATPLTRRQFIEAAPSTEDLSSAAGPLFKSAKESGVALTSDRYADFLVDLETRLVNEGIDNMLHPKATAVFDALSRRLGDDPTIGELMTMRRQIGTASNSIAPELADERRIAVIMRENLDGLIDNMTDADIVAGSAAGVSDNLSAARDLWSRSKKSEIIDDIIARAENQASGVENGIRIGFRALLNNPKRLRGFTPDEISAMKEVVAGTASTKALRLLGKLSFGTKGTNFLGGSIGMAAGSAAGGYVGGAAAPILGYMAQKAADASTRRGGDLVRALAATGGQLPGGNSGRLAEMLLKGFPPLVGTGAPEKPEDEGGRLSRRLQDM